MKYRLNITRLLVAFALTILVSSAHADSVDGFKYDVSSSPSCVGPFGSASQALSCHTTAVSAAAIADTGGVGNAGCSFSAGATGEDNLPVVPWTFYGTINATNDYPCQWAPGGTGPGYHSTWTIGVTINRNVCVAGDDDPGGPCAPPPPEECDNEVGDGTWQVSTTPISGAKWCEGLCEITAGPSTCGGPPGLQTCTTWVSVSALTCTGSEDGDDDGLGDDGDGPADEPPSGSSPSGDLGSAGEVGESCVDIGDGEYCAAPDNGGDCGYVNDTYTCLSKVKQDECKVLGDGGRLCGAAANSTPPVPDNGTPGQLATPDGQVTGTAPGTSGGIPGSTVNNYNYFGPTTVAGSTRDPGTTGASGASASGSPHALLPGQQPGDGDGDGDGSGGECVGVGCTASLPELEEIGTLTSAMQAFWDDLGEVPIVAAASGIAPSFGGGACPAWSTSVALYSASIDVDFTSMCGIWIDISPALSMVCLVAFGLLAFRILFSA